MLQANRQQSQAPQTEIELPLPKGVLQADALDFHMTATLIERSANRRGEKLTPGQWLGRYQIMSRFATGGMAELYLAHAEGAAGINKLVVIKRVLPYLADDPRFVTMFLDEARLGARLSHGNIAPVHEVGYDDATGSFFLAMEYVHGIELKKLLAKHDRSDQPLPVAMALSIGIQVAGALHYAHNLLDENDQPLGIVHRDVSLSNILVGFDGGVKVIDFGVAKAAITAQTAAQTLKGKFCYMSPEQCQARPVDRRSDVFSMGIVLFEMTTMYRAYPKTENDFELLERIVRAPAPRPSSVCADYPIQLEQVLLKALQKNPDDRYQSAEEMAAALERVAHQLGIIPSVRALGAHVREMFPNEHNTQSSSRLIGMASLQSEYDQLADTAVQPMPARENDACYARGSEEVPRFTEQDLFPTIVAKQLAKPTPGLAGDVDRRLPLWSALALGGAIGTVIGSLLRLLVHLLS